MSVAAADVPDPRDFPTQSDNQDALSAYKRNVIGSSFQSQLISAYSTMDEDGALSRIAALEVAEAHVAQLEQIKNDRPRYQMSLRQRTMYVLAYADWLCGGDPPKDLK